jgi:hypothetical protein
MQLATNRRDASQRLSFFLRIVPLDCLPVEFACDRVLGGFGLARAAIVTFGPVFGFMLSWFC